MILEELLDKPIWQMTGEELLFLARHPTILTITEASPYHCQLVMQRILRLAGLPLDQEPERLKFSHLRTIAAPNQRREIIRYAFLLSRADG